MTLSEARILRPGALLRDRSRRPRANWFWIVVHLNERGGVTLCYYNEPGVDNFGRPTGEREWNHQFPVWIPYLSNRWDEVERIA